MSSDFIEWGVEVEGGPQRLYRGRVQECTDILLGRH
jgi:hypothetical protein